MNPLTIEALHRIFPRAGEDWLYAIIDVLNGTEIDTDNEVASFLAQIYHESNGLTALEENLNYSANGLVAVWPSRFWLPTANVPVCPPGKVDAREYARQPEKIANKAYANRMENGDELSGDGWRNRGMGPIQLTGRKNRRLLQEATGLPYLDQPDLLLDPVGGMTSALWFWRANGLDAYDDDEDVTQETKIINGGTVGLAHRQALFNEILLILTGQA